uniref:HDC02620 n=1 Tax=Drosophila melanogaster TaxID=7227 RepID=Q6IHG7_DROME|nr:TPA_inf: HDC02620 [Drosophila melanogaster]
MEEIDGDLKAGHREPPEEVNFCLADIDCHVSRLIVICHQVGQVGQVGEDVDWHEKAKHKRKAQANKKTPDKTAQLATQLNVNILTAPHPEEPRSVCPSVSFNRSSSYVASDGYIFTINRRAPAHRKMRNQPTKSHKSQSCSIPGCPQTLAQ